MPASSSQEFGSHGPPASSVFSSASSSRRMSQTSSSLRLWFSDAAGCGPSARCRSRRVEAGAAARLQIAHGDQAVVGLDHREAADLVTIGKVADRRQLGARPQVAIVDLPLDAGDDLIGEWLAAFVADGEGEHAGSRSRSNWPGRLDQYSYGV